MDLLSEEKVTQFRKSNTGPIVGDQLESARQDSLVLQDITVSLPEDIPGSGYKMIKVRTEDLDRPVKFINRNYHFPLEAPSYSIFHDLVNVLFFRGSDYSDGHLLLSEKANIVFLDIPEETGTGQDFILYGVVKEDTNGDGRLNERDSSELFVSDLTGHNFRRICDEKLYVVDYSIDLEKMEIIFKIQKRNTGESAADQPRIERLYIYDLREKKISTPMDIQEFVTQARKYILN